MVKQDWTRRAVRVDKPWGYEEHFAFVDGLYSGKVLFVWARHSLSLKFHERKDKTVSVHRGRLSVEIGHSPEALETFALEPGESMRITPMTVYRMTAVVDSQVMETSTPVLDDAVRLADRYGRAGLPDARREPWAGG